ncbi:MAG: SRPBCC family protein [Alphaproteobacteria bacterium]|nr:MAG: SRPBCC family protein [Alphaproteobacteria bacterium]
MFDTENGTHADILPPAVKNEKHEGPYPSSFACAVTINRPADELYAIWRDFTNLPRFMENIEAVTILSDRRSHWVVRAPTGTAEWDSEITEDEPGRRISWASLPDASVDNAGTVEFKTGPEGRGTEVRALISFKPPMGGAGRMVAGWMQKDPHIQAKRDLRRFKQLIETGEIAASPANQDQPAS